MKNKKKNPRGYLLLESLVGAGIVASVMTAALVQVGDADVRIVKEQRERTAQSLVYESYERRRAQGFDALPSTPTTLATDEGVAAGGGTYKRTVKVTSVGAESMGSFGSRTVEVAYKEIEVAVRFTSTTATPSGAATAVQVVQRFRIYRT